MTSNNHIFIRILPLLFVLFLFMPATTQAQQTDLSLQEYQLRTLLDSTRHERNDSTRIKINEAFYTLLNNTLQDNMAVSWSFDSLLIGKPTSDDGNIRIFNWNIQQNNGSNIYCMIIQRLDSNKVIALKSQPSLPLLNEDQIFTKGDWPGGLIYRIISRVEAEQPFYTLLSWDGVNRNTFRKTIDALSFDEAGMPLFGAPVFKTKEGTMHRVVFEYSSESSFTLTYDRQKITLSNVRKSQSKINDEMIVMDRLVPLNESLIGERWAYVPAGNIYDAYVFFDQYWTYVEDIAPRNEASPKKDQPKSKKVEYDLFPKDR